MTYTTTNVSANSSVVYLPSNTWGSTYTLPTSCTTSWSKSMDENGVKVIEQLSKLYDLLCKCKNMAGGVVLPELLEKLVGLIAEASNQWGTGWIQGNLWPTTPTITTGVYTTTPANSTYYPTWTSTLGNTSAGTLNTNTPTTLLNSWSTYTY